MKSLILKTLPVLVVGLGALGTAHADNCTSLANKRMCVTFVYSTDFSNSYTATFGADGSFTFPDVSGTAGTYTCYGGNLTEVHYMYGGSEEQAWYGAAGKKGRTIMGYGKSPANSYMYSFKSVPGACTAAASSKPGQRQAD
jgi:hypothetical protein